MSRESLKLYPKPNAVEGTENANTDAVKIEEIIRHKCITNFFLFIKKFSTVQRHNFKRHNNK